MSSLTSPKNVEDAMSSLSEPEPEYWDKVSEAFFLRSLRCLMNSLSEGKAVLERSKASIGTRVRTFELKGFEETFYPEIHWQIVGIC